MVASAVADLSHTAVPAGHSVSSVWPTVTPAGPAFASVQSPPPRVEDTVIIVPAYKEAAAIGGVIDELRLSLNPIVLVVDLPDGDGTGTVARRRGVQVVDQVDRGKGNAVRLGLDFVREYYPNAQYVGLVDADLTYPASPLPAMREILRSVPSVGMVIARRENLRNNGAKSRIFAFGNRLLAGCHRTLNGIPLQDPLSGLRLMRVEAVAGWVPKARGFDIEAELNNQVRNVRGMGISEVPVPYRTRVGEKKLRFRHGITILGRMVSLLFSRPRQRTRGEQG